MALSGWCTAPIGARLRHDQCRIPATCACGCHGENPAQNKGIAVDWGQQKTAPGGVSAPNSQGLASDTRSAD